MEAKFKLSLILLIIILGSSGFATTTNLLSYPEDETWRATIRVLRIDLNCTIKERDKEGGFILFTFTYNGTTSNGTIEVFKVKTERSYYTKVKITLSSHPGYIESYIMNKLIERLKSDYGTLLSSNSSTQKTQKEGKNEDNY